MSMLARVEYRQSSVFAEDRYHRPASPDSAAISADKPTLWRSSSSESDEFYNLTQLADVTLAAAPVNYSWCFFPPEGSWEEEALDLRVPRRRFSLLSSGDSLPHSESSDLSPQRETEGFLDLSHTGRAASYGGHVTDRPSVIRRLLPSIDGQQKPTEKHNCSECERVYSTASNLARHKQSHCDNDHELKIRKCPECDKLYQSLPAYAMHVRTHTQGCRCPYCGKCFSRPWLLQGHIRTHTGERPFKCPVCAKAFADKSNLRAHVQTHSDVKPHVCPRCGKAFALKSYLYKHEESSCMKEKRQSRNKNDTNVTSQN